MTCSPRMCHQSEEERVPDTKDSPPEGPIMPPCLSDGRRQNVRDIVKRATTALAFCTWLGSMAYATLAPTP
jgi:hypothetical protein